jgi:hypothetical protein
MGNFEGKMMIKHQPREVPYSQTNPYCMGERERERERWSRRRRSRRRRRRSTS